MSPPTGRRQVRLWLLCNAGALILSVAALLAARNASLEGVAGSFLTPGLFLSALAGCGIHGGCGEIQFLSSLVLASTLIWGGIFTIVANLGLDMKREWKGT